MANKTVKRKGIRRILPEKGVYSVILLVMSLVAIVFLALMAIVNAFPADITMMLVGALLGLFLLAWVLMARKNRGLRVFGLLMAVLFVAFYGLGSYYLGTTYAMVSKISTENADLQPVEGFDPTQDSFNLYITGIDQWNKEKGEDLERSDVNMIVTVCPKTRKVLLTSIPRDTYIELYHVPEMDKLTHTGIYGVEETIKSVENWLDLDMHYYVKMNFSAVRDVINAMGGIDVYSPVAFQTSLWSYKFEKGWNHLDGKEALFFARERKAFEGKDSLRVENQQRVVEACIKKLTSSTTLLTKYGDIVGAAGNSLETNMSNDDMQRLVKMQLSDLSEWDIQTQKIEGDYEMDYVASMAQTQKYQVYKTYPESVASCVDAINAVMNPTDAELEELAENRKRETALGFLRKMLGRKDTAEEAADEESASGN